MKRARTLLMLVATLAFTLAAFSGGCAQSESEGNTMTLKGAGS